MKTKVKFVSIILLNIFLLAGCKKEEKTETCSDGIQNQGETGIDCGGTCTPCAKLICDGNGTTSYYPLVSGNSWSYDYTMSGISQNVTPTLTVGGTTSYDSKTYFELEDPTSTMYGGTLLYREDATTHNIYYYSSGAEYLHVPASPTLNQSWSSSYGDTRKVTNLSASITTYNCSYTGLLEISHYNSSMTLEAKEYYKKGLGLVCREKPGSYFGTSKYTLTEVTLK